MGNSHSIIVSRLPKRFESLTAVDSLDFETEEIQIFGLLERARVRSQD